MKVSFIPGNLHLFPNTEGEHVVELSGQTILKTRSDKVALKVFRQLRVELESRFPSKEPTAEERQELLRNAVGDSLVGHNSLGGRKKKTSAGGTRTFGG